MDAMEHIRDGEFELSCVDPPYGLKRFINGIDNNSMIKTKANGEFNNLVPDKKYFDELFRVSRNQIIFGANNFTLPKSEYFLVWDKYQTVENFASAEYAWVSHGLRMPAKVFRYSIHKHNQCEIKIHPTQKPVRLYAWILHTYAKKNWRILETHLGSGSNAIAAHYFGCDFVWCEIDKNYYDASIKRFVN
jgi:site-specific DNA-methyltransferase (adenine-specific)